MSRRVFDDITSTGGVVIVAVLLVATLPGLVREAYAFSKTGQVMLWGAIASFTLAFVMATLVGLGSWHARHTPEEAPVFSPRSAVVAAS